MLHGAVLTRRQLYLDSTSICRQCLRRLSQVSPRARRFTTSSAKHNDDARLPARGLALGPYFSANRALKNTSWKVQLGRILSKHGATSTPVKAPEAPDATRADVKPVQEETVGDLLPHRKRRRRREESESAEVSLPLDASNRLTTISSNLPSRSLRRLLTTYLSLSKPRLSFLIVLTTTAAYSVYPVPALLQWTTAVAPTLSTLTLAFLTTGTFLTCASANTLNMMAEPAYDAKMSRTRNRPLVRNLISQRGALVFAVATGTLGVIALYWGVNPTTAALGAANIGLYAFVYTPLKRISVVNTWVGAVVGAVPPLMGWTAAAGQSATGAGDWRELLFGERSLGGWLFAGLLFCWQFPHFNALSWGIREEYKNAGYRMLCWTNPARNGRVALRYSVLMVPICLGLSYSGLVEKAFIPLSCAVNGWVIYEAARFWKYEGQRGSARGLFWASVWHLPVVLVLAMVLKKGLLERSWAVVTGKSTTEEDLWDDLVADDQDDLT